MFCKKINGCKFGFWWNVPIFAIPNRENEGAQQEAIYILKMLSNKGLEISKILLQKH